MTARAFGCQKVFLSKADSRVSKTVSAVVEKFGGDFSVENVTSIETFVKKWPGVVVHLTMFGLPIDDFVEEFKIVDSDILFVVCLLYTSPSPRDATLSRIPAAC